MTNKILNIVLNRCSSLLSENKDKILAAAKKRAMEEANNQIPSPADLQLQLQSLQTSDNAQEGLLKAEKTYNKFISLIDKAKSKLENTKLELEAIKAKLDAITSTLDIFNNFIPVVEGLLNIISGVVVGIDAALAASSATAANGLTINKLGEKKKDLKDAVKKAKGGVRSFSDATSYFEDEINKFLPFITIGISGLELAIQKLSDLRTQIISIYTQFILSLTLPQLIDNELFEETSIESYISDEDNLSTVITDIFNVGEGNEGDGSGDGGSGEGDGGSGDGSDGDGSGDGDGGSGDDGSDDGSGDGDDDFSIEESSTQLAFKKFNQ